MNLVTSSLSAGCLQFALNVSGRGNFVRVEKPKQSVECKFIQQWKNKMICVESAVFLFVQVSFSNTVVADRKMLGALTTLALFHPCILIVHDIHFHTS